MNGQEVSPTTCIGMQHQDQMVMDATRRERNAKMVDTWQETNAHIYNTYTFVWSCVVYEQPFIHATRIK